MYDARKYVVQPSILSGCVQVSGAKNSALKLLTASILSEENIELNMYRNARTERALP